tara:strand:- start:417 stop:605 length:189 start_codon:yes stop_codon:yes gene_type:complete
MVSKKYYNYNKKKNKKKNKKSFSSKETQTDLTIKRINQLEEYEDDLVTIYSNEEQYKWNLID